MVPPLTLFLYAYKITAEFIYMEQFCLKVRITYGSNIVLLFTSYITRAEKIQNLCFFLIVILTYKYKKNRNFVYAQNKQGDSIHIYNVTAEF